MKIYLLFPSVSLMSKHDILNELNFSTRIQEDFSKPESLICTIHMCVDSASAKHIIWC